MIIAVFDGCSKRVDIDGKLTQWDYGQVLQICGMEVEEEQIQVHWWYLGKWKTVTSQLTYQMNY